MVINASYHFCLKFKHRHWTPSDCLQRGFGPEPIDSAVETLTDLPTR